jgi:hypothetical protein
MIARTCIPVRCTRWWDAEAPCCQLMYLIETPGHQRDCFTTDKSNRSGTPMPYGRVPYSAPCRRVHVSCPVHLDSWNACLAHGSRTYATPVPTCGYHTCHLRGESG